MLSAAGIYDLYVFYLAFQTGAWQLFAEAGAMLVLCIVAGISAWLSRRGRPHLGMGLMIGVMLITISLISSLIADLGLVLGLIAVILTVLVATQLLPRKQASWAIIASIGVGLSVWLLDQSGGLTYRLTVPSLQIATPMVAGVLALVYTVFIIRQFTNYTLRTKLILVLVVIGVLSVGSVTLLTNYLTRQTLTDNANQALLVAAERTAAGLDTFINTNLEILRSETQNPDLIDYLSLPPETRIKSDLEQEVAAFLRTFARRDQIFISSYALLDRQGLDVLDTYVQDVGLDKSDRDYFQTPLRTGLPYISPVIISATSGELAFYLSSPIRNAAGEIIGLLRIRYKAVILQQIVTENNGLAGPGSFAMLLDEEQIRLADGEEPELISTSVVPLEPARLAQLQAAGRLPQRPVAELSTNLPDFAQGLANAAAQPLFTGGVHPEDAGTNHQDQVAVASMQTQPWRVAYVQTPEVFLAPVQAQTRTALLIAVGVVLVVAGVAFGLGQFLARPIVRLTAVAQRVTAGDLAVRAVVESHDETGQLAEAFNQMTAQLRGFIASLEDQVRERTAELNLSLEVGQRASTIRDLQELLPTITEFIRERFNLYYTQIYFVDDLGQNLILKAGTGTVGEVLLARGHKMPIGEGSMVGRVAATGKSVVVSQTENSDIHKPNPLLPNTRCELTVPLLVGKRVLGVLDLQASQANAFSLGSLTVFEAMATQLAIAIDSAQQWALAQESQGKAEEALRRLTRENWVEQLAKSKNLGYAYNLANVTALSPTAVPDIQTDLVAPLLVQNETIGRLAVAKPAGKSWSDDEYTFLGAVAQQLAQKVENLRLFEQTQQRAAREQLARQISDKVRASRDIDSALKTATAELAQALGVARAAVNLQLAPQIEPDASVVAEGEGGVE
jgi:GAF domain-containing protein/HAMP domain-containing protein